MGLQIFCSYAVRPQTPNLVDPTHNLLATPTKTTLLALEFFESLSGHAPQGSGTERSGSSEGRCSDSVGAEATIQQLPFLKRQCLYMERSLRLFEEKLLLNYPGVWRRALRASDFYALCLRARCAEPTVLGGLGDTVRSYRFASQGEALETELCKPASSGSMLWVLPAGHQETNHIKQPEPAIQSWGCNSKDLYGLKCLRQLPLGSILR